MLVMLPTDRQTQKQMEPNILPTPTDSVSVVENMSNRRKIKLMVFGRLLWTESKDGHTESGLTIVGYRLVRTRDTPQK